MNLFHGHLNLFLEPIQEQGDRYALIDPHLDSSLLETEIMDLKMN